MRVFSNGLAVKIDLQCRRHRRCGFDPWVKKISWRRKWQPTPVSLSGKFHGWGSLAGYSPWGRKESDHDIATSLAHSFILPWREY